MGSVRLRADQVKRLKGAKCGPGEVILSAIKRFKAGEISVMQNERTKKHAPIALQTFSTRNKEILKYSGSELRAILDAHFDNPLDLRSEIDKHERYINSYFKSIEKVEYQIEKAE